MTFPQYAVSKWIGHSIAISGKNYANAVPDELFERAASAGESAPAGAQRQAQRKASEPPRNEQKQDNRADRASLSKSAPCSKEGEDLRPDAASPPLWIGPAKKWSRGESNPRAGIVSRALLRA